MKIELIYHGTREKTNVYQLSLKQVEDKFMKSELFERDWM